MSRNDARHLPLTTALLATAALLLAGCAAADDEPDDVVAADASAPAAVAPATSSDCAGGVVVDPQGSPDEQKLYTAIVLSKVSGSGEVAVVDSWDRQEDAGLKVRGGATDAQQAVLDDALAGGLLAVQRAPRLADPAELLVGKDKGRYVQYSYTRRSTQDVVVSCADGTEPVEASWTSFELVSTGLSSCTDTPDPVSEFVAADAISTYCDRA
ncbi:hypothetical protein ATJ88_0100 [Isoptericola jiangsuensis]|uniref:Lipoprotein n=1 Tax=Isoptericola jiangsuensis TaxID=548579 RepID=A0A2A9ESF2_9MICO|nr:hypothetical protein [Isoptericola jiangsuensis]PFG41461.1 hypothetical protein ATJ88_0100 [Isoptericola jiangsuensis]